MSHYKNRKEERVIPTSTKVLGASATLLDTDSYVLVNGPSSSGAGSPGFTTQTDSVGFDTAAPQAEWSANGQIGVLNNITCSVWLKPTGTALTTDSKVFHVWQLGNSSNEFYIEMKGTVTGDHLCPIEHSDTSI